MPDSLTQELSDYYDSVPYDSHPFAQTAPEHLEALAFLFGLNAVPPAQARVLELGCAAGGNLIPFAARHPQARALGVDLSAVQVAQGVQAIAHTGLDNVELRVFNLAEIDASFGQFDYIVCHGVYSWVPEAVQQAILRVCSQNLAPEGVAYISYNVYPGWKAREIVRDAMILRGGPRDTPEEKLSYARGMLEFLEQSARPGSVLHKALEETMPIIRNASPYYLLHEFLEPFNAPCYFKEFVARAQAQGLAYLADAEPSTMFVQNHGETVREPLMRECGDSQVLMEQYLDFLVNRTFRQSLLVPQARASQIRYQLDPERLRTLAFAGVFQGIDGAPITLDAGAQACTALRQHRVTLHLPAQKAAAQLLEACYPASLPFEALLAAVVERTGEASTAVEPVLLSMLESLLILGAVRVRRRPVAAAATVPAQPTVLAALRRAPGLALSAGASAGATNQWHESTALSPVERCLMPLLDGAHGHEALAEHLVTEAQADRLRFSRNDQPVTGDAALRDFARQQVTLALHELRRKGLLVI